MNLSREQLAQRLRAVLGTGAVSDEPHEVASYSGAGKPAALLCLPDSAEQIAAVLRLCAEAQAAVVPWGGGTAMAIGNPPRRLDLVISTRQMNRLIEHDPANLTVTVQSGMALGALQIALQAKRQFAPFDVPFPERSTVGGMIAANLNGPKRDSYGSLRDLVIGLRIVLGTGESIKTGGKVVKNVAGYDLSKLFTGSLGSLGVITEATLRVAPIPEGKVTGVAQGTLLQATQLAHELALSQLLPAAGVIDRGAEKPDWRLTVSFEGFAETVRRQIHDLNDLAKRQGMTLETHHGDKQERIWRDIADLPLQADRLTYRVTVPRSTVMSVLTALNGSLLGAAASTISADYASGTIWIVMPAYQTNVGHFARLTAMARDQHGHAVMFAAPPELKRGVEVWGPAPPAIALMRDIKQRFDPSGMLNPGRFVGAL